MVVKSIALKFKDRLRLRMISDAHVGAKAAEEKRLKRDIATILSEPDSMVILGGDQVEAITRQDARRFMASSIREDLTLEMDSLLNAQLREAVKVFKPLADEGRILGALTGNHELSVKKHTSFDIHREFCDLLGIPNLGYSCLLRLTLDQGRRYTKRNYVVKCHHGHGGGGRKSGASINRMEEMAGEFEFDCLFMGHNHKRHASTRTKLAVTGNGEPRLIEKDISFIRSGGYYKTYQAGVDPSYGEVAGYAPVKVGSPPYAEIRIEGKNKELRTTVTQ